MVRLLLALSLAVIACEAVPAAEPSSPLRVMTFNIRYGTAKDGDNHWDKRKEQLLDTIQEFDPDLLGTQETLGFQRDEIAKRFPGYGVVSAGRDDGLEKGEMCAVFYRKSRFELTNSGHFWLSETPEKAGSKSWDAALPRIVTTLTLTDRAAANRSLHFLNTHFDHLGQKARENSAGLMADFVAALKDSPPVIVTGDFNTGEASPPYQRLFAEVPGRGQILQDAFRIAHPKKSNEEVTFNGFDPARREGDRIDWIACTRDFKVHSVEIVHTAKDGRAPSDHFPVTAVLDWNAK
jgi:endonuclease/exonuclease/phosphatase family metal-dependent hydrolase